MDFKAENGQFIKIQANREIGPQSNIDANIDGECIWKVDFPNDVHSLCCFTFCFSIISHEYKCVCWKWCFTIDWLSSEKFPLFRCSRGNRRESFADLRLVFSLTDYQAGPGTIVLSSRVLFLERVTQYKSSVTCLSPRPENKCGGKIDARKQTRVLS